MIRNAIAAQIQTWFPAPEVHAHCDGPCGVYDPASARITAEAVVSMTKKILELEVPSAGDAGAMAAYHNTLSRFIQIKGRTGPEDEGRTFDSMDGLFQATPSGQVS